MNYSALFETIKGYIENDFPNTSFTASSGSGQVTLTSKEQIDTFIKQAEQRIFNSVQILELRKASTNVLPIGTQYFGLPNDWLATFSLAVIDSTGAYHYLLNKDVSFIREAFPSPASRGKPEYYALFDNNTLLFGPTSNANYSLQLHYFYYPPSIVTASTSWLGDNFDSVLLYGSLLEAAIFIKGEPDIMQGYQKRYDEALLMLKQLSEGKNRTDTYRSGQIRYPVQ